MSDIKPVRAKVTPKKVKDEVDEKLETLYLKSENKHHSISSKVIETGIKLKPLKTIEHKKTEKEQYSLENLQRLQK